MTSCVRTREKYNIIQKNITKVNTERNVSNNGKILHLYQYKETKKNKTPG